MRSLYLLLLCTASVYVQAQQTATHTLYFNFDKTTLTPASQKSFDSLLNGLRQAGLASIVVRGHTDAKGNDAYNNKLSQQRAAIIAAQLQSKFSENASVRIESFGEKELLTTDELLEHLNRRVTMVFSYSNNHSPQPDIALQGFFTDVPLQQFAIDLSDTVEVTGKDGTYIKIAPGSIQTKEGKTAKGSAQICLKEYYEPRDIMLAGVHSQSTQGLLQTGGMFKLLIIQGGDTMASATKKKVEIRMPVRNKELTGMNVYKRAAENDTAEWDNTGREFMAVSEHWTWPYYNRLWNVYHLWNVNYSRLAVGLKHHDEYNVRNPLFGFKNYAKKVKMDFEKLDSATVRVRAQVKYRRYGYKQLGIKNLDTTFLSTRVQRQYKAYISNINWINCDRFYNTENPTDFYVSTPGYQGMNVVIYFKRLNAFMNARLENGRYKVDKIPVNEPVIIVGFGKKDGKYFFAKQPYLIDKDGVAKLTVKAVEETAFEKATQGLDVY